MMQDLLSRLPAPLSVYILLELPNLKDLYAAILSSPHLYAAFRLNAYRVFHSIAQRTIPHELFGVIYMHMHFREHSSSSLGVDILQDFQTRLKTAEVVQASSGAWQNEFSSATIFHTIAQAVRLYDVGYFILRSKLNYFATLQLQQLVDPQFRYTRERVMQQNPEGTTLALPKGLRDPSWTEEGRILWILWILAIAQMISCRYPTYSCKDALDYLIQSQVRLSPLAHRWTDEVVTEITKSMLAGPTLQPPTGSQESKSRHLDCNDSITLRPYRIPCPPYLTATSGLEETMPASPMFFWHPAVMTKSSLNAVVWDIFDPMFSRENPTARYVRAMGNSPDSPIQASDRTVFDRLGFGFWDRRRISADFRLLMPPRDHDHVKEYQSLFVPGGPDHISRSDALFRLLSIYKQEKEREQNSWERGFTLKLEDDGQNNTVTPGKVT